MTQKINKKFLFTILIFISFILLSAFLIEYGLDHQPCKLCIYERIPYFVAFFLIIKILATESYQKISLFILFIVFLISAVLAFYHFGIEQGFFNESIVCTAGNFSENLSFGGESFKYIITSNFLSGRWFGA